jgi:hypothetical protein
LVDTEGLPMRIVVHSAGIQDRDGAALVLDRIRQSFPWLELIWGGWRLQRRAGGRRRGQSPRPAHGDRQVQRRHEGLCRASAALGGCLIATDALNSFLHSTNESCARVAVGDPRLGMFVVVAAISLGNCRIGGIGIPAGCR